MEMETSDHVAGSRTWKQLSRSWVFPHEAAVGLMSCIHIFIIQSFFNPLASVGEFPLLRVKKEKKKNKLLEANLVSQLG